MISNSRRKLFAAWSRDKSIKITFVAWYFAFTISSIAFRVLEASINRKCIILKWCVLLFISKYQLKIIISDVHFARRPCLLHFWYLWPAHFAASSVAVMRSALESKKKISKKPGIDPLLYSLYVGDMACVTLCASSRVFNRHLHDVILSIMKSKVLISILLLLYRKHHIY